MALPTAVDGVITQGSCHLEQSSFNPRATLQSIGDVIDLPAFRIGSMLETIGDGVAHEARSEST